MKQVTDTGAIEKRLDEMIAANPEQVEKAKANAKLAGWFTGQVMKATGGKANPAGQRDGGGRSWGCNGPPQGPRARRRHHPMCADHARFCRNNPVICLALRG
jgi:hypothetical protein